MEENRENSSGFAAGLMLGMIVGAASVVFLQTEKGKNLLAELTEKSKDKIEELSENDLVREKIKEAQNAVAAAKDLLEKTKSSISSEISELDKLDHSEKASKKQRFFTQS